MTNFHSASPHKVTDRLLVFEFLICFKKKYIYDFDFWMETLRWTRFKVLHIWVLALIDELLASMKAHVVFGCWGGVIHLSINHLKSVTICDIIIAEAVLITFNKIIYKVEVKTHMVGFRHICSVLLKWNLKNNHLSCYSIII